MSEHEKPPVARFCAKIVEGSFEANCATPSVFIRSTFDGKTVTWAPEKKSARDHPKWNSIFQKEVTQLPVTYKLECFAKSKSIDKEELLGARQIVCEVAQDECTEDWTVTVPPELVNKVKANRSLTSVGSSSEQVSISSPRGHSWSDCELSSLSTTESTSSITSLAASGGAGTSGGPGKLHITIVYSLVLLPNDKATNSGKSPATSRPRLGSRFPKFSKKEKKEPRDSKDMLKDSRDKEKKEKKEKKDKKHKKEKSPSSPGSYSLGLPLTKQLVKYMQAKNITAIKDFLLRATKEEVNMPIDEQGNTLLHIACMDCHILPREIILELLHNPHIDVNARNKAANTPLHYLCSKWQDTDITLFHIFISKGADVNAQNATIESPLFKAILNKSVRCLILKTLLKAGADPNPVNSHGECVLHYAARQGRMDLVMLLLEYFQDVTRVGREGLTPFEIASAEEKLHTGQRAEEYRMVAQLLYKVEELDRFLREIHLYEHRQYFIENELFLDVVVHFKEPDFDRLELRMGPKTKLVRGVTEYKRKMMSDENIFEQKLLALQNRRPVDEEYIEEVRQTLINMAHSTGQDVVFIPFEQLEFVMELGRGSSGSVWKGMLRATAAGRLEERAIEVAIKTIINGTDDFLDEFAKEFKVLHSVRHKNVVKLFGVSLKPTLNLVMEFCGRGSLYHVLTSDKIADFGWDLFFDICKQSVDGLNALHTHQPETILHRDLKTLNLLMTQDMIVKVADFGLSLETNAKSVDLREQRGTSAYMPPELFYGEKYSTKSDIYSLGIVFWEILYRVMYGKYQKPFGEFEKFKGPQAEILIIVSVAAQDTPLRPTIPVNTPPQLARLITRCFDRDPDVRPECPEAMEVLVAAEEEYLANKVVWDSFLLQEMTV